MQHSTGNVKQLHEKLAELNIPGRLPHGAISEMARRIGLHHFQITRILRGKSGSQQEIEAVLTEAISILEEAGKSHLHTAQELRKVA